MKKIFALIVTLIVLSGTTFAQLATYTGAGGGGTTVLGVPNETVSSLMYSGFGSNTPCSSGGLSGITVSTTWSTYSTAGPRVYIKMTPNAGYLLNVTGINAGLRRSGTGPTCVRFAYSLDNGVTWIDDAACHAPINSGCGSTAVSAWTGGPLPTGIASTVNGIIVAIFPYAPGGSSGTFQVNTFNVLGNVAVACTPPLAITGTTTICAGPSSATFLSDATAGGTWSSSSTTVATIGSGSGLLTGLTGGTTTITYSTGVGCNATKIVTVNPLPSGITGVTTVCVGSTTVLTDAGGGTWTSSNTSVATIGATSGIVSGLAAGTSTITYLLGTGCGVTTTVTVNPTPAPIIAGVTAFCAGGTTTLSDPSTGGAWSSSNTLVATVSGGGLVSGISGGTATISYSYSTGCSATTTVTIFPLPSTIVGTINVCVGSTIILTDATPGGVWSSSVTSVATISGGVVNGIVTGTSTISYTLSTGCYVSTVVIVDPLPAAITGSTIICSGLSATLSDATTGGTWSSSNTLVATIGAGSGTYTGLTAGTSIMTYTASTSCITTATVTVNLLPPAIGGSKNVCIGGTSALTGGGGGTWSSGNTAVATVDPSGLVSGISLGTASITFTIGTGCSSTTVVTVNPLPPAITGIASACPGTTTVLSDASPGGAWSTGNTLIATVVAGSGVVSGASAGTATITYTSALGCVATIPVTINPLPAAITGVVSACAGLTTTLSDATGSGSWASINTLVATIAGTTGIVTGVTPGTSTIVYTLSTTGCSISTTVTINALPSSIIGNKDVCQGLTTTLSDAGGGTWSSDNTSVATVSLSGAGVVSGVSAGTTNITYTLATGCTGTVVVTVNPLPPAISGTAVVCQGSTTGLSDITGGGFWTSSVTTVATIAFGSGLVSGITAGTTLVTYTLPTGCITTAVVTVNPLAPITGIPYICTGSTAVLNDAITGGTWVSSSPGVATIGLSSGLLTAVSSGTSVITYTFPLTGCTVTNTINVNPFPSTISGGVTVCTGATTALSDTPPGGSWYSSNPGVASIDPVTGVVSGILVGTTIITYTHGSGCTVTESMTVNLAVAPITGVHDMCDAGATMLVNDADVPRGVWTSTLVTITSSGLARAYAPGAAMITYTLPTGCFTTATLTVNKVPGTINGPANICTGIPVTYSDTTVGGTWGSSDPGVGVVPATGAVMGLTAGPAILTYTGSTGCTVTDTIVVYTTPSAITGGADICLGATTSLSNSVTGGVWSYAPSGVVTLGPGIGDVNGLASGTALISYTTGTACRVTKTVTVLPKPTLYGLTGGGSLCAGALGVHVGLSGSATGIEYKLYNTGMLVDSLPGTGASLDYGRINTAGIYTVVADNTATTCSMNMSGGATVIIKPTLVPSVHLAAVPGDTICAGTALTFIATPFNGGVLPVYQWKVNGVNMAATSTFTYTPTDGDVVVVMLISNATCADPVNAFDNVTMSVVTPVVPDVAITADPGTSIAKGQRVTFTANVTNAVPTPSFQWYKNGVILVGETLPTFAGDNFSDYDTISCRVTGGGMCQLSGSERVYLHVRTDGISRAASADRLTVMPNPSNGEFTVTGTIGTSTDMEVSMELTNMLGQLVYQGSVIAHGGVLNEFVRLNKTLANGMYILNINSAGASKAFHIVIEQ